MTECPMCWRRLTGAGGRCGTCTGEDWERADRLTVDGENRPPEPRKMDGKQIFQLNRTARTA